MEGRQETLCAAHRFRLPDRRQDRCPRRIRYLLLAGFSRESRLGRFQLFNQQRPARSASPAGVVEQSVPFGGSAGGWKVAGRTVGHWPGIQSSAQTYLPFVKPTVESGGSRPKLARLGGRAGV